MKKIPKKYFVIVGIVLLGAAYFGLKDEEQRKTVIVAKSDIVQEVSVTGKTKARNEVDLGFDMGGRVSRVNTDVGKFVQRGQVLAELDISSELASISKEKSLLSEEEANWSEQGKEIALSIMEAYSVTDNAVRNKIDQFFKTPRDNPYFEVKFTDGNYTHYFNVPSDVVIDLNSERRSIEGILKSWQSEITKINSSNAGDFSNSAISKMNTVSNFLNKVAYAINSFAPADFNYESTVTGYKTSVDTARSTVATAKEKISSISGQEARVSQIKSSIQSLEAGLSKSKIFAPFSGTVTEQNAKLGQVAKAGEALISIISQGDMYIEANVSEINIAKVALQNKAKVEFDALPGEVFLGRVVFIDPAETIVDGVSNYKVRIDLENVDARVKSGLTANIKIETGLKTGVLTIPAYAIIKENEKSFVNKLVNGAVTKVEVQTGLAGSDGSVEILNGISEGEVVEF